MFVMVCMTKAVSLLGTKAKGRNVQNYDANGVGNGLFNDVLSKPFVARCAPQKEMGRFLSHADLFD